MCSGVTWYRELGLAAVHVEEGDARGAARQQRINKQLRKRRFAGPLGGPRASTGSVAHAAREHLSGHDAQARAPHLNDTSSYGREGCTVSCQARCELQAQGREHPTLLPHTATAAAGCPAAMPAALADAMPSAACQNEKVCGVRGKSWDKDL